MTVLMAARQFVCVSLSVCVCVSVSLCVCAPERETVCVCVHLRDREREWCVCTKEREMECICVLVCELPYLDLSLYCLQLSIWDTAGVERFRTLTRNYYRNAHAAVFVYSVAEASSLHYLSQWIKDTQNFAPNATRMLLGNKTDMEPLEIDEMTSKSYASAHEFDLHYQISCKTNSGIDEAFEQLAKLLHKSATLDKKRNVDSSVVAMLPSIEEREGRGMACSC